MKYRIIEVLNPSTGSIYWQLESRYWFWPFWRTSGSVYNSFLTLNAAKSRVKDLEAKPIKNIKKVIPH
jgi:hypothetical protein